MATSMCHVCGAQKDMEVKEFYPFGEDFIADEPVDPIWEIECQPGGVAFGPGDWKLISLCLACWHRLSPDMWTCQEHYESLNPVTPYAELPNLKDHNGDNHD